MRFVSASKFKAAHSAQKIIFLSARISFLALCTHAQPNTFSNFPAAVRRHMHLQQRDRVHLSSVL